MLARLAHDIYWLGRHLVRAEHTARMLDGLFHADLQGRVDDPASVTLSWQALLTIMGAGENRAATGRDEVVRLLTTGTDNPVSIISCVDAAREGARTLRDTISAEMWESVNTYDLQLRRRDLDDGLRTGPYSIYAFVKERSALFWGLTARTMQKDEPRAFLVAGGRIEAADMVLRMLRVAMPPEDRDEGPRRDGNALALLRAVGGFQAFMRAAASPPNAGPVTRFMLYEREFPDSVAASIQSLDGALERVEVDPQDAPPVLRVRRMLADLDFRARVSESPDVVTPWLRPLQQELERLDAEIHDRYFHPSTVVPDPHLLMRFALRYNAEYRYSEPVFDQHNVLRVKPASTPLQRVRGFRLSVDPSARTRSHVDYFGTEAIEFNVAAEHERLAIVAEAEVITEAPPEPPGAGWEALRERTYSDAGGEFLLPTGDEPANGALGQLHEAVRDGGPRETLLAVCRVIPERFEYNQGATFVGSTVDDLLAGGAGVCQDFVHLSLILLRQQGIAARYVSGYLFASPGDGGSGLRGGGHTRVARGAAARRRERRRARLGRRRPHQQPARGRGAREDRPRPPLRRRGRRSRASTRAAAARPSTT